MSSSPSNVMDGVLYFGYNEEGEKTNPGKIVEWFNADFMKMHKVYAIKEEEPFLLKIYTRDREYANKAIRKKGGRKPMLMGQEVHGEIIVACGRCGYHSSEGSNVRRHLKKSVCCRDRGYSRKELDGLNRIERQKFIRRIASAKFRAKKKQEAVPMQSECPENDVQTIGNLECENNSKGSVKRRKKSQVSKVLTLGPLVENEAVKKISFDVFTVNEKNLRIAWKPPSCHKADGETCQIVFKGARMKRRCLDLPVPIILTYRKLDCKIHHCNFTLFHPHARKAIREDNRTKTSVNVRTYGDTVMTQEFYHHFVSLLSVMKMKSSQCARHLTNVWETIIVERLQCATVPEEFRKIITLSKQTVKSIWANVEDESGRKNPLLCARSKRKKRSQNISPPAASHHTHTPVQSSNDITFSHTNGLNTYSTMPEIPLQHQTQSVPPNHLHAHLQQQIHSHQHHHSQQQQQPDQNYQQTCMKRFPHPMSKSSIAGSNHTLALPHSHAMLQAPSHTHWVGPVSQSHATQYHPNLPYNSIPSHHEEYYSVQASFVTQYTPVTVGTSS